jgi:NADPH:quinone reductase-like Zn-dependent oxidoreductase
VDSMKSVRLHQYGGPEVLTYEDAPRPEAGEGTVLLRVHAAGVNPVDWRIRQGLNQRPKHTLPLIPGSELSGIVEHVGSGVTRVARGDAVYGYIDAAHNGAYAEYALVRAQDLARKPQSLDHVHAAAVPLAALAAAQGLCGPNALNVTSGQTVLIHGAAGGVGHFAVQFAKFLGAKVIATASTRNIDFLHEIGADVVIDYTQQRFEDVARNVDAVFDTIGGDTLSRSWMLLKRGATLVSTVGLPCASTAKTKGVRAAMVVTRANAAQLETIGRLIDDEIIKPVVSVVLPLAQARQAHELSQAGHARGKIVLQVAA